MLFSFIKLCSTDGCDTMLIRMADLMQVNICNDSASIFNYRSLLLASFRDSTVTESSAVYASLRSALCKGPLDLQSPATPTFLGAAYEHKKGTAFRIADARTYVAISGTIDLDLLLLDISYFNEMFKKIDDDMETSMDKYGKIKYFGLQGY